MYGKYVEPLRKSQETEDFPPLMVIEWMPTDDVSSLVILSPAILTFVNTAMTWSGRMVWTPPSHHTWSKAFQRSSWSHYNVEENLLQMAYL